MRHSLLITSLVVAFLPTAPLAQSSETDAAMGRLLQQHLRRPAPVADYQQRILSVGAEMDVDGVAGLTIADYAQFGLMQRAANRGSQLATFLANDLDGDGIVTRAEVLPRARALASRRPESERAAAIEAEVAKAMQRDANSDGMVSVQEYNNPATGPVMRLVQRSSLTWMEIFARFDADKDGITSFEEIGSVADSTLQRIDANADGELDQDEIDIFHNELKAGAQYKPEPTLMPQIEAYVAALPE